MKKPRPGDVEHSPRLKMAAMEIRQILDKYDIAGVVDLFEPGFNEILIKVNPSFSAADIETNRQLKLTPLLEGVDDIARKKKIADTINMFANMRVYLGQVAGVFMQSEHAARAMYKVGAPPPPDADKIILKPSN